MPQSSLSPCHTFGFADAALPPAPTPPRVGPSDYRLLSPRVPVSARSVGCFNQSSVNNMRRSADVLRLRNRFQVVGVHARSVSANVVDNQTYRDLPPKKNPRVPVGVGAPVVETKAPIPSAHKRSKPHPTFRSLLYFNFPQKTALDSLYSVGGDQDFYCVHANMVHHLDPRCQVDG